MKNRNLKGHACRQAGFTLIELLVVITIMGILTIITASQFTLAKKRATDSQRKTDLSSVAKALQMYYSDYGKYPKSGDLRDGSSLTAGKGVNDLWGLEMRDATGYTYMKTVPKENVLLLPTQYCYMVSPDQKKFSLYTVLENTSDKECLKDGTGKLLYTACGKPNAYCFAIASVNADPDDPALTIY